LVAHQPVTPARADGIGTLRAFAGDFLAFMGNRAWGAGALLALGAVVEGIGLILLLPILSVVLGPDAGNGWTDSITRALLAFLPQSTPLRQLAFLLMLFAVLLALRAAIILKRDTVLNQLQIGFVESHRLRIIRMIASTPWDVISRLRHARITHVLGGDIQACGNAAYLLLQCCIGLAMLAGQVVLVLLLSPALALIVILLLGAGALALRPVLSRSRRLGAALTDSNLELVASTTQFLGGLKLALSQNLQSGFVSEFEETLGTAATRRLDFVRQRTKAQLALTAVAALVAGAAMLVGIGVLDAAPATLIAFLFVLARMNGPVALIQNAAQQIFHSLPAYRKITELEAELGQHRLEGIAAPVVSRRLAGRVEFAGVRFLHCDGANGHRAGGLHHLDLVIEQGSFVGVTGPSGAGKTTFADLLVGLYPPQSGQISVAGEPLTGESLLAWRHSVSYVSQDPFLFHDTIRRNLLWARADASEPELWAALRRAGAEHVVRHAPAGLETVVGERGSLMSGGERQRIALARALLRRPSLLLLDEATNAIDVDGERAILRDLADDPDRPTIVMIAHREASLIPCERLIAFDSGRLVHG
jgi:ATP-binding cassette subfamily C protein